MFERICWNEGPLIRRAGSILGHLDSLEESGIAPGDTRADFRLLIPVILAKGIRYHPSKRMLFEE